MITVSFTKYYDPIVDLYCRQRVYARVVFLNQHCVDTYPGTCMHQISSSRRNTHTHTRTHVHAIILVVPYHGLNVAGAFCDHGTNRVRSSTHLPCNYYVCMILLLVEAATQKSHAMLTHWERMTQICINKLTIIASDNGLSPHRRQAIMWTNAGIVLIGP